jgi:hypothetical protein
VEKYDRDRQAADGNKERHIKDAICMRDKGRNATDKHLTFNPLNAELNPICHLLALLGAHHIPHVSRIRVNTNCLIIH